MKKCLSVCLLLCLLLAMSPAPAFAEETASDPAASSGTQAPDSTPDAEKPDPEPDITVDPVGEWQQDARGWRFLGTADNNYQRGSVLFRYKSGLLRRFLFDWEGYLQTGDEDSEVFLLGNRYLVNPEKNLADPNTCWAAMNYTYVHAGVGVTYYDANGISYVGWLKENASDYVYQTIIQREGMKDLYIFVTGPQYIPESDDPDYPAGSGHRIPAGRYFFDNNGHLAHQEGLYYGDDGWLYYVTNRGQIIWQGEAMNSRTTLANRQTAELLQPTMRFVQQQLLDKFNTSRVNSGSTVLKLRDSLCLAATMRAAEMARMHSANHTRPDGSSWDTILFSRYQKEEKSAAVTYNVVGADEIVFSDILSTDAAYHYVGIGKCTSVNGQTYYAIIYSEQGGSVQ